MEDLHVGCGAFIIREGKPEQVFICTSISLCRQNGWSWTYHGANVNPTKDGFICASCSEDEDWVYIAAFEFLEELP